MAIKHRKILGLTDDGNDNTVGVNEWDEIQKGNLACTLPVRYRI